MQTENENLKTRLNKMENDVRQINKRLDENNYNTDGNIVAIIENLRKELKEDIKNTIIANTQQIFDQEKIKIEIKKDIFDSMQEENEKLRREPNLIIYNVCESNKEIGSEREIDDISKCHQIFREGVKDGEYEIEKSTYTRKG